MFEFDYKLLCALGATCIGLYSYFPYIQGMLKGVARPHIYTWAIWTITQSIAAFGVWTGGGGWSSIGLAIGSVLLAVTTMLAIRYGTQDITFFDTALLIAAVSGVLIYFITYNPLYSVLIATFVDAVGYIPTIRKTWRDPSSEPPFLWALWVISTILALCGLQAYNLLTATWLAAACACNCITLTVAVMRGKWFSR